MPLELLKKYIVTVNQDISYNEEAIEFSVNGAAE
jgi:hypothetical protein